MKKFLLFCFLGLGLIQNVFAQQPFITIPDSSLLMVDTLRPLLKKFGNVNISGYIQPQYQWAESKGAKGFSGGDFSSNSNNRFTLRRGRIRFDYLKLNKQKLPIIYFVFQFDGTERGVFIRDFFGRIYEKKWGLLCFTTGVYARPFGFEVNYSSAVRESPERGRVSQTLLPVERDLGAMVTIQPRKASGLLNRFSLDFSVSNGQGLTNNLEFDQTKDLIGRLSFIRANHVNKFDFSASISYLSGGINQQIPTRYFLQTGSNGNQVFVVDSNPSNVGRLAPRQYYEADAQFRLKTKWGITELRAEFWMGTQTGSKSSNRTPANTTELANPIYIRPFNAGIFYFIQPVFKPNYQLVFKYDFFDPNSKVSGAEIGPASSNFTEADIKFQTFGFGFNYLINTNLKLMLFYDWVRNEKTSLKGFEQDLKDDVFTCRMQFSF
ncbi:MAG: porin [Bacteroidia bacterium]|nr:porin [Bacteroidia bacterium]